MNIALLAAAALLPALWGCSDPSPSPSSATDNLAASSSSTGNGQAVEDAAVSEAKDAVPKAMKDPSSAKFGRVWSLGPEMACGMVNGKNSFGGFIGEQRFIYVMGEVNFDNHSRKFSHSWNTLCVDRYL
jgi:hypothetical protein